MYRKISQAQINRQAHRIHTTHEEINDVFTPFKTQKTRCSFQLGLYNFIDVHFAKGLLFSLSTFSDPWEQ